MKSHGITFVPIHPTENNFKKCEYHLSLYYTFRILKLVMVFMPTTMCSVTILHHIQLTLVYELVEGVLHTVYN